VIRPLSAFWLRPRLVAAIGLGAVLALALPIQPVVSRLLVAWCVGVAAYVVLIVAQAGGQSQQALRRTATQLDDSAPVITLFAILATGASLGAVATLVAAPNASGSAHVLDLVLAVATMILSWIFVQVVFTVHYAHVYYGDDADGHSRGGLDFNGDDAPDFYDFLYFTVTVGATSQTSDVDVTSKRMRRIVVAQGAYAFLFNTSILALAVNLAAGFAGQH
jgi:uncharacterized membrane protein